MMHKVALILTSKADTDFSKKYVSNFYLSLSKNENGKI